MKTYRLLNPKERIRKGDEFWGRYRDYDPNEKLMWHPISKDAFGEAVGDVFKLPVRRAIEKRSSRCKYCGKKISVKSSFCDDSHAATYNAIMGSIV
jgi:hypothetical protein